MAFSKAKMGTIQKLLSSLPLQGNLSEMLCAGLPHALEEKPEDRHPMQEVVLKMANEVLANAGDEAQAAEAARRSEADAAQVELQSHQAAVSAARETLAAAQAVVVERKEALGECKQKVTHEEQHHKKAEAGDKAKTKATSALEKERTQVAGLLANVDQKDSFDTLETFLTAENADRVLIAALPSVVAKEPSERAGFDLSVLACLRDLLGKKVTAMDAEVQVEMAEQADAHAEALGAFAILDLARDRMREAAAGLRKAQSAAEAAEESRDEAVATASQQEDAVTKKLTEVTKAQQKAIRFREGLDLLKLLETGPQAEEVAAPDVEMQAAEVQAADVQMEAAVQAAA